MKARLKILALLCPLVVLFDQLTKFLIVLGLEIGGKISIIPGLFDIVHVRNPGAAFGSFSGLSDSVRLPFFFLTSAIALIVLLIYFFRTQEDQKSMFVCLSLILGGAIGNITDRIFRGEVVDFVSFHWYDQWLNLHLGSWQRRILLEWPAFNIADMAISVAAIWMMILMFKKKA
ncbi:MAG: signal peptidase II [Deltaproteobacteria bacterium]|nr:signal peptidase II [Deltaproteobacteria bacterium]